MNDSKLLILVVEDSPTQAVQLEYILSADGRYQVAVAGDGLEALEFLKSRVPQLVITDIVMPNLDGYGLCRRIKEDPRLSQIPVVFLTSQTDQESVILGLASGGDNFISKPYDPEFLLPRIQCLLAHHGISPMGAEAIGPVAMAGRNGGDSIIDVFFPADMRKERELGLAIGAIKKTLHRLNDTGFF